MKKKIGLISVIVLLVLVTFVGGTVYWLFVKAKEISHSALNVSGGSTTAPSENPTSAISMPSADVPGQDLENVPRFAGSLRTNYFVSDDKNFTSVEYVAATTTTALTDYYKQYLQGLNWTFTSNDKKTYNFTSEGYDLTVELVAENDSPALVEYSLNLTKVTY